MSKLKVIKFLSTYKATLNEIVYNKEDFCYDKCYLRVIFKDTSFIYKAHACSKVPKGYIMIGKMQRENIEVSLDEEVMVEFFEIFDRKTCPPIDKVVVGIDPKVDESDHYKIKKNLIDHVLTAGQYFYFNKNGKTHTIRIRIINLSFLVQCHVSNSTDGPFIINSMGLMLNNSNLIITH